MIGKLKGRVDSLGDDLVIVDVGGVGYEVYCSARTLQRLPAIGEAVTLSIETEMREDAIRLFGFTTPLEREWYRLLHTVQGVGAKVALAVLGTLDVGELAAAIALKDTAAISRAPGVGKRLAERIAAELKDKAPAAGLGDAVHLRLQADLATVRAGGPLADAVSALVNLGYPQLQANAAVAAAAREAGEGATTEVLIRRGLKELAR